MQKGTTVQVLDHGYITLVDWMGSDEAIVEAARMSTGKGFISWKPYKTCKKCQASWSTEEPDKVLQYDAGGKYIRCEHDFEKSPNGDAGLLDTLWRKKHATPFEMGEVLIEVQAPIFVFREWHRHRTMSYNEFSARYAQMPNLHYLPDPARIQKQSTTNKQGSAESFSDQEAQRIIDGLGSQQEDVYHHYDAWVEQGLAREVARINTPVSRYSKQRAKSNLRNWLAFLNLRFRPDAQLEIREYAKVMAQMLSNLFPRTWALFEEYDLYGARFSRTELRLLRKTMLAFFEGGHSAEFTSGSMARYLKNEGEKVGLTGRKLAEFMEKLTEGGEKILAG